ncbi:tetratricopeptide repeat protein [Ottowia sp.]|uniref:O-linked N-acetylglucosamine transferase, SPINDLY family protein n=1 Tax=Ottowia sp. TaxID=1898956 RepID=UPI003A897A69
MNQPKQALPALQTSAQLDGRNVQTQCLLALACARLSQKAEAMAYLDRAVALAPNQANVWYDRGSTLFTLDHYALALQSFDRALELAPSHADTWLNRGNTLRKLERPHEAISSYEHGIDVSPGHPDLWRSLGDALYAVRRFQDASACHKKALSLDSRLTNAWVGLGDVLAHYAHYEQALAHYDQALQLDPNHELAWVQHGSALLRQGLRPQALQSLQRAATINPDNDLTTGHLLECLQHLAQWSGLQTLERQVMQLVQAEKWRHSPLSLMVIAQASATDLLRAGTVFAGDICKFQDTAKPVAPTKPAASQRLRIGYLSSDLREHPVAFLAAGLFESHDKARFETYALSIGPQPSVSSMRARLAKAFEHFVEIQEQKDADAAARIQTLQLDILIDLNGYTTHSRSGLLAYRLAPVQVAYLGYPATTGMAEVDYILGDRWVTPAECAAEFSEQIVRLPESFQCNDDQRRIAPQTPSRASLGLPEPEGGSGFVFCCLNNTYKITPLMFDIWMRLLAQVPGSVLWLLGESDVAQRNLRAEAKARGIAPDRLVFAQRLPYENYLAQYRQADLFLDTLPFNAGTTASDALWAGLPVLTQLGHTFAGRMAASLLDAVGLPELITRSAQDYEALALKLATEPGLLNSLRQRLADNIPTAPLFNTQRFTRHLESAFETMAARQRQGLPPAAFDVPPMD